MWVPSPRFGEYRNFLISSWWCCYVVSLTWFCHTPVEVVFTLCVYPCSFGRYQRRIWFQGEHHTPSFRITMTWKLSGVARVPWTAVRSGARALQVPWTAVRGGVQIGLLSLRLSISQAASLGDFSLAPACPIEKVTLWVCFLHYEGVAEDKVFAQTGNRTRDSESEAQYAIRSPRVLLTISSRRLSMG